MNEAEKIEWKDPLEQERKVAIDILSNWGARYVSPRYQDDINCAVHHSANIIAKAIASAVDHERECCAKVAETSDDACSPSHVATFIRARTKAQKD